MTAAILITLSVLLLIAYVFDLTSIHTKIPSVILLLALGYGVKRLAEFIGLGIPKLGEALGVFATLGLILIVLEGGLELHVNRSKLKLITKSLLGAVLSMVALAFALAYFFHYTEGYPLSKSMINVIPLCVISSAIAIPSVRNLSTKNREFVIYESSLSDITGVIIFNYLVFNSVYNFNSFTQFGWEFLLIIAASMVATVGLAYLLRKIDHHIKFIPIILIVILIYEILKVYHLPSLIFILIFGLFLGNLEGIAKLKVLKRFHVESLIPEVTRFTDVVIEGAFLIRSMFFLLFGYQLETADLLNTETLVIAVIIVVAIYAVRLLQLLISSLPIVPLLFVAPRGLITILLFIAILPKDALPIVNNSLITQVIVLTALVMMFGLLINPQKEEERLPIAEPNPIDDSDSTSAILQ